MEVKLSGFMRDGRRKDFPLRDRACIIGRGKDCNLKIPLQSVSREHCELSVSGDELSVKDLASSNGTYLNNRRVNESALHAGDRLTVGPVIFTVQIDGVPDHVAPAKRVPASAEVQELAVADDDALELEADTTIAETDPIAALEALAAETDQTKKKGKQ